MIKAIFNLTYVLAVLFGHTLFAQTNVYHPIPTENAIWRTDFYSAYGNDCCCSGTGPCFEEDEYQIEAKGDTVINGMLYAKLYQTGQKANYRMGSSTSCPPGCSQAPQYYDEGLVGFIRNDSIHKKVFYSSSYSFEEELLYDFDLKVGDTLPETAICARGSNFVLGEDSVEINGKYHKRFQIGSYQSGNTPYVNLIEGVGSEFGLTSLLTEFPGPDYRITLKCLWVNDSVVFRNEGDCKLITGVTPIHRTERLRLFPNPAKEEFQLIVRESFFEAQLSIVDAFGRVIAKHLVVSGKQSIAIDGIPQGVYTVLIIDSAGYSQNIPLMVK